MKKMTMIGLVALGMAACSSYSKEQGEAAQEMCDCLAENANEDFNFIWANCNKDLNESYEAEILSDEGWHEALKEKCPDFADEMSD
jgi:hypothetical protein